MSVANSSENNVEISALTGTLAGMTKESLLKKFARVKDDTGSPEVQVALLTRELEIVAAHSKKNPMDRHAQRGLMAKVGSRKTLLEYLKRESPERYRSLISSLGLRK